MAIHDCEVCGELCDCDCDDTMVPQPEDCTHVCEDDDDFEDRDWESEDYEARWE